MSAKATLPRHPPTTRLLPPRTAKSTAATTKSPAARGPEHRGRIDLLLPRTDGSAGHDRRGEADQSPVLSERRYERQAAHLFDVLGNDNGGIG